MSAPGQFVVRTTHRVRVLDPADGYTLPHEHLICGLRARWVGTGDAWSLDPPGTRVDLDSLDELRHSPQGSIRENLVLSDWYLAATELAAVRASNGQLVTDLTVKGLSRDPRLTQRAADRAGVHAVVGIGTYLASALSAEERDESVEALIDRWTRQADDGIDGCTAGIIGELGVGPDFCAAEQRTLRAAAAVATRTGLPINVHIEPGSGRAHEALDVLADAGADLRCVTLSHADADPDADELIGLLDRGCYTEFDLFGQAPLFRFGRRHLADDETRATVVAGLVDRGYLDQLLLSQDICMRHCLTRYGATDMPTLRGTSSPHSATGSVPRQFTKRLASTHFAYST